MEVHNNARHVLNTGNKTNDDFIQYKTYKLKYYLGKIHKDVVVHTHIDKFSINVKSSHLVGIGHLIDASGSDLDACWSRDFSYPVTRLFISDEGRIGILQSQTRNPDVDMLDLEALMYRKSEQFPFISTWLNKQSTLSNKLIGFGCSSATLEMPWSTILNHSSGLMPSLLKRISTPAPSIMINLLDVEGNPQGVHSIYDESLDKFTKHKVAEDTGQKWRVSISDEVHQKMNSIRKAMLPTEAAGYLLGLYNFEALRISIVFASDGPCLQNRSTSVVLDSIENDKEIENIQSQCNNMLIPLGTWHSHPSTSATPSEKDFNALCEIAQDDRNVPTIMLIQADHNLEILVKYNRHIRIDGLK